MSEMEAAALTVTVKTKPETKTHEKQVKKKHETKWNILYEIIILPTNET